jgi:hypothetical protein
MVQELADIPQMTCLMSIRMALGSHIDNADRRQNSGKERSFPAGVADLPQSVPQQQSNGKAGETSQWRLFYAAGSAGQVQEI